jgi:hypothetical protein
MTRSLSASAPPIKDDKSPNARGAEITACQGFKPLKLNPAARRKFHPFHPSYPAPEVKGGFRLDGHRLMEYSFSYAQQCNLFIFNKLHKMPAVFRQGYGASRKPGRAGHRPPALEGMPPAAAPTARREKSPPG